MRKKQLSKEKKAKPKPRPKNRYMRNAKLSEYKFLKILRGFAEGFSPKALAAESGISEKTIRATYAALRRKVMEAAKSGRPVFGRGSRYLYDGGSLTEKGESFLNAVSNSRVFKSYLADHAPRLTDDAEKETYVFDLGMRIFSGLVVADKEFYEISPGLKRSLELLHALQLWIDANAHTPGFADEHAATLERYYRLRRMAELVREQHQILALRSSGKHRYAGEHYFIDLRKHLLKHPINQY